jgi:hypothetical protein
MPNAQFALGQALGGDAVVVVAEGEVGRLLEHPPKAGDEVLQGKLVEMAHVEVARHRRRWRIDREQGVRVGDGLVVLMDALLDPVLLPRRFDLAWLVAAVETVAVGRCIGSRVARVVGAHALTARVGRRRYRVVRCR